MCADWRASGAAVGGQPWAENEIPTNVTSMTFYPVSYDDMTDPDRDEDGVTTVDELFVYGTDPSEADSDHDGLTDGEELFTYNTDPLNPHSINPDMCDGLAVNAGSEDLFSVPQGSTNTVLEHLFYSGTTNGTFTIPTPSDGYAILEVSASGCGSGELIVDGRVVPLIGRPQTRGGTRGMKSAPRRGPSDSPILRLPLMKGWTHSLWIQGDPLIDVELNSSDFAFGVRPAALESPGWIVFPNTKASPACIHDFTTRTRKVKLDPGDSADDLSCTWTSGGGGVEAAGTATVPSLFLRIFPGG